MDTAELAKYDAAVQRVAKDVADENLLTLDFTRNAIYGRNKLSSEKRTSNFAQQKVINIRKHRFESAAAKSFSASNAHVRQAAVGSFCLWGGGCCCAQEGKLLSRTGNLQRK